MNYLKKKLKSHKRGHEDPEDFDDYIPVAPPHPSELLRQQQAQEALAKATPEELKAHEEKKRLEEERQKAKEEAKKDSEGWQFFEQLTARVNDTVSKSQTVIEKLKDSTTADELTKQANLELGFVEPESDEEPERGPSFGKGQWIGFEEDGASGSAFDEQPKVESRKASLVVVEPPNDAEVLDLLNDFGFGGPVIESHSTLDTLAPEVPVFYGSDNEALEDDPFDTSYVNVSLVEKRAAEEVLLEKKRIEAEAAAALEKAKEEAASFDIDAKFTELPVSYSDQDLAAEPEVCASPVNPDNLDLESVVSPVKEPEEEPWQEEPEAIVDEVEAPSVLEVEQQDSLAVTPSDFKSISNMASPGDEEPDIDDPAIASIYMHGTKVLSRFGSNTSLASILSNPFLNDAGEVPDMYTSGACTPLSGAATPNRRGSTNPFEQSPEEEENTGFGANAIAALTADFCNAISDEPEPVAPSKPKPPKPPAPAAAASPPVPPAPAPVAVPPVPPAPVPAPVPPVVHPAPVVAPALPPAPQLVAAPPPPLPPVPTPVAAAEPPVVPPAPAAASEEPFDPFATIQDDQSEHSGSNRPSLSMDHDSGPGAHATAFLDAPAIPDYPSDVSDTEDAETFPDQVNDEVPGAARRRSSAFQREAATHDDISSPARKSSIPASNKVDSRRSSTASGEAKPYFDPFQRVVERDALSPTSPDDEKPNSDAQPDYVRQDDHEDVAPVETETTEQVNSGIINDAFDDNSQEVEEETVPQYNQETVDDEPEAEAAVTAISEGLAAATTTSSDTTAVIEAPDTTTIDTYAGSDSGVGIGGGLDDTDPGRDPFDTSDFSFAPADDSVPYTDNAAFDAFSSRFDQTADEGKSAAFDAFASPRHVPGTKSEAPVADDGAFDVFDPFMTPSIRPPKNTPIKFQKEPSKDSFDDDDEPTDFKIVIKAKMRDTSDGAKGLAIAPLLPPPPKTPVKSAREAEVYQPRSDFEEFDTILAAKRAAMAEPPKTLVRSTEEWPTPGLGEAATKHTENIESPGTPLFDDDTSQPLEEFPAKFDGDGWEMYIRHPAKKKLTANRFWKKIFVRISETAVVQLFNKKEDNDPFQELPLQPSYSLSEISAQQYDQYGKIFTVKLQYIFYRERVGVRKGQIAKVIQGQIQSMGQIAKLGMPLEHAAQISELLKLGTLNYDDVKLFAQVVEEALFRLPLHRDRALTYKTEEIQMTMQDELYVEQSTTGSIIKQLARVRLFFIAFINDMPGVEVGLNDLTRQGKEVVGRHDIIPVVTEEWIRIEDYEFHSCVMLEEFDKTRTIKLIPPDACYFELMRFRVRPPKNRELPLQVSTNLTITKTKVELRCEVLVPGCISRKHGQIPCEDISIRIHIPECWIYFFRNEKHLRYGSVKSANRRHGKIKGLERLLGATTNIEPTLLETSAGQAKYEHVHHALVWRIPRLPKEGQGAYTQQTLLLRLPLTSFDQVPETFYEFVHVEFVMPSTTTSHAVVRSISVTSEEPPEKYVRYVAKHEYKVGMSIHHSYEENEYAASASVPTAARAIVEEPAKVVEDVEEDEKDSDSE